MLTKPKSNQRRPGLGSAQDEVTTARARRDPADTSIAACPAPAPRTVAVAPPLDVTVATSWLLVDHVNCGSVTVAPEGSMATAVIWTEPLTRTAREVGSICTRDGQHGRRVR